MYSNANVWMQTFDCCCTRADNLILQAVEHHQPDWHTVNLEEPAVDMQQMQSQADAYGCTIFEKSLPYIKSKVENRQI